MRYRGQETRLPIVEPPDGDFSAAFVREHQRLFGLTFLGRPIERYAARVELSTQPDPLPDEGAFERGDRAVPAHHVTAWHENAGQLQTAVYYRESLFPGTRIMGPAVIVEPGWSAHVTKYGDLRLISEERRDPPEARDAAAASEEIRADPVELELFHHCFASVAEQMGASLQRCQWSCTVSYGGKSHGRVRQRQPSRQR